jgi:hypothetical protein
MTELVHYVPDTVKTHRTQSTGTIRLMTMTFSERLKWARQNAGFASTREAANRFGWNENTYKSHEGGARGKDRRPPDEDAVSKYARGFRVDFIWLYTGRGTPEKRSSAKIVGRIGAGAEIHPEFEQVPPEGLYEIDSDVPLPPEMIGFEVFGDSMKPRYDEGDIIICPAAGIALDNLRDGEEVALRTADGRRFLKKVFRHNGLFTLGSHNADPIPDVAIVWASDVWTVIRAKKWRRINGK